MKYVLLTLVCLLLSWCCVSSLSAAEFTLVRDGAAECRVVAGPDLSPSEVTAVRELRQFVHEMSGAELPVSGIHDERGTPRIVVGQDAVKTLYPDVDLAGLGDEGYIIRQEGRDLLIAGGRLRGTLYGVFTLLETLGCRWMAPQESFIPKRQTLVVYDMNLREVPILKQRNVMYMNTSGVWCARNKINRNGWETIPEEYGGSFQTVGHQAHNLYLLMEEAGVEVEQDMLCLWNGERNRAQLCLTHPRVLDAFAAAQIKIAQSKPGVPYVQISQEDNKIYCQCERCAKVDAEADSHAGQMVYAVNYIARKMAKEVPGTDLMFSAYLTTRKPPRNMALEKNVIVALALIESNYMRPLAEGHVEVNREGRDDLAGWSKLTDKLFVWDYVVNFWHYNMPFPNLDVLTANTKFFVDHNVRHLMFQGAHSGYNAEFSQLRRWVLAKAMWNPDADNQQLITDFLNHYYGPAAPDIHNYIDVTHKPSRETIFPSRIYDRLNAPYVQAEVIAEAEVMMRRAQESVKGHRVYEKRVRHAHLPVWYIIAHRMPGGRTWQAVEKATGRPVDLSAIAAQVRQLIDDDPDNQAMAYGDHDPFMPWVHWLSDYAARAARDGLPVPPELEGVDPASFCLVQACQMDALSRGWEKAEGASDGWGLTIDMPAWRNVHYLSAGEEYEPGKKYEVYARVKIVKKVKDSGRAFTIGEFNRKIDGSIDHPHWDVSQFPDDSFKTVKIGEITDPAAFYFCNNPGVVDELILDCFWLQEMP